MTTTTMTTRTEVSKIIWKISYIDVDCFAYGGDFSDDDGDDNSDDDCWHGSDGWLLDAFDKW